MLYKCMSEYVYILCTWFLSKTECLHYSVYLVLEQD